MDLRMNPLRCVSIVTLCLLSAPVAAQVASRTDVEGYLRPEEILQCLRDHDQVVTFNRQMSDEKIQIERITAQLEQEQEVLTTRGAALSAWLKRQPPASGAEALPEMEQHFKYVSQRQNARRQYNSAVASHRARLDQHKGVVDSFNRRIAALDQRSNIVDRYCTVIKVRPADMAQAKAVIAQEKMQ